MWIIILCNDVDVVEDKSHFFFMINLIVDIIGLIIK